MINPIQFSVVIPLYNKEEHIHACLSSVIAQSHPPSEIIVIDDGSVDEGPEVVRNYTDARIRLLIQSNSGPGAARNHGMKQARNSWVSFIDADDLWHADHLKIHADAINRHPFSGLIGTGLRRSKNPEETVYKLRPYCGETRVVDYVSAAAIRILSANNDDELFYTSSATVNRRIALANGGFAKSYPGEDTSTWLKIALRAPVVVSDARTVVYRVQTGGVMDLHSSVWNSNAVLTHPLRLTIVEALEGNSDHKASLDLKKYLSAIDANAIKGALYNENIAEAKLLAKILSPNCDMYLGKARYLLRLPNFVSSLFIRAYKKLKCLTTGGVDNEE